MDGIFAPVVEHSVHFLFPHQRKETTFAPLNLWKLNKKGDVGWGTTTLWRLCCGTGITTVMTKPRPRSRDLANPTNSGLPVLLGVLFWP